MYSLTLKNHQGKNLLSGNLHKGSASISAQRNIQFNVVCNYILVKCVTHFGIGNVLALHKQLAKGKEGNYNNEMDPYPSKPKWTS